LSRYLRQAFILAALALAWEILARLNIWASAAVPAGNRYSVRVGQELSGGEIAGRTWYSLSLIAVGLGLAIATSFLAVP